MNKLSFKFLAICMVVILASCSNDDDVKPISPVVSNESLRIHGGNILVNLPAAEYKYDYTVNIPVDADWLSVNSEESTGLTLILSVDENTTAAERSAVVKVNEKASGDLIATINITQTNFAINVGEFIIEEVFFTGTALPETGSPSKFIGDQYLKIRNNTDADLYADGMMLILSSSLLSAQSTSFPYGDFRKQNATGNAFYIIPGDGDDTLVKAGESIIVVNNAQNHLETNPNAWDATIAHFEWYDVSSNDKFLDTDNTEVPNLDKWYASTSTVQNLHNRGYNAVAIAMPPVDLDAASFLAQYAVVAGTKYVFHSPNGMDIDMNLRGYNVPIDWILDAVNTGAKDNFHTSQWDSSLDAGYAWCGIGDSDPTRFNKAIRRKSDTNGKLVDTNNSSNDFDSNVKASLIKSDM